MVAISWSNYETNARIPQAHGSALQHKCRGELDREPQKAPVRVRRRAKLTSKQVDIIVRDHQAGLPIQQSQRSSTSTARPSITP